jgi:hypothetical protein
MASKKRVTTQKQRAFRRAKRRVFLLEVGIMAMIGGFYLYQHYGQQYGQHYKPIRNTYLLAKTP